MSDKKTITPEEYVAMIISSLHETHYFEDNDVSEEQMRKLFWEKIIWKGKVNEGFYSLDEEELEEILVKGVEVGVDNSLASLTEKGMLQMGVNQKGNFDYAVTKKGESYVDRFAVVRVIKKHGKKTDTE